MSCFKQRLQLKFVISVLGKPVNTPDSNGFYMKLDLLGFKYIKEYRDRSNNEFQMMARKIEKEVKN